MGVKIPIVGTDRSRIKISYRGQYNFEKMYKEAVYWFKTNEYNFNEKTHIETIRPIGKEHIINFYGSRDLDDYVRYHINVEIWTLRTAAIKVGDKKLVDGEIQIRVNGIMELDFKNTFGTTKLGIVLRNFYHKYIIKRRIWTKYSSDVITETNSLIRTFKTNLGLINP